MTKIYRPKLMVSARKQVIDYLAANGSRLCKDAFETHKTKRRTGNQENAYGWAVYDNKKLVRQGRPNANPAISPAGIHGREYWGYIEIQKFFDSYVPDRDGLTLVIANAMAYSSWQEEGLEFPNGDFKVYLIVTQTFMALHNVSLDFRNKYGLGKAVELPHWWWTRDPSDEIGLRK